MTTLETSLTINTRKQINWSWQLKMKVLMFTARSRKDLRVRAIPNTFEATVKT
jgi:hypothetical protein